MRKIPARLKRVSNGTGIRKPRVQPWTREQKIQVRQILKIKKVDKEKQTKISKKNAWLPKVPLEQRLMLRANPEAGAARMQGEWIALQHQLGRMSQEQGDGDTMVRFRTDHGYRTGSTTSYEVGVEDWSRPRGQWASTHVPSLPSDDIYSWELTTRVEDPVKPQPPRGHWMDAGQPWRMPVIHKVKKWHQPSPVEVRKNQNNLFISEGGSEKKLLLGETSVMRFIGNRNANALMKPEVSLKKVLPGVVPGKNTLIYDGLYEAVKDGVVIQRLEKYQNVVVHPHQISLVLKKLGNDVKTAFEVFLWARGIPGFKHDTVNYSTMIRMLGYDGNWTMAEHLFKEMVESKLEIDAFAVNNMIQCYLKVNRIHNALDLYRQMEGLYRCQPNNWTFSLLINWLGKFGSKEQLHKVYLDLMRTPEKAGANIFNTMIYNFAKVGDMSNAKEAANQMKKWGISFSSATCGILIHMYARDEDFEAADKVYSEYISAGLPADLTVFNNAVWSYGNSPCPKDAEVVMNHIVKAGLAPDKFTYCSIVSSWAKQGEMQKAKTWFDRAVETGVTPSPEMCNALLDGFLSAKMIKPVEELILVTMPQFSVKPTLETFTFLLKHYSKSQRLDAKTLRKLMEATGHSANEYLTSVFTSLRYGRNLAAASETFFVAAKRERPRWALSFGNALVNYLQNFGFTQEAYMVFEGMLATRLLSRGIWEEMDGTWYIWLLDMEVGTALVALAKGLAICKDKLEECFGPDKVIIMTGYIRCNSKDVTEAVDASLDMLNSPFEQNIQLGRFMCETNLFRDWIIEPQVLRELSW